MSDETKLSFGAMILFGFIIVCIMTGIMYDLYLSSPSCGQEAIMSEAQLTEIYSECVYKRVGTKPVQGESIGGSDALSWSMKCKASDTHFHNIMAYLRLSGRYDRYEQPKEEVMEVALFWLVCFFLGLAIGVLSYLIGGSHDNS